MYKIVMKTTGTPKTMLKQFRGFVKDGLFSLVNDWHQNTMPKHFETSAVNRYGISPRTKGYMIKKAKMKHHQRPLVFSGESERRIKRRVRITGNSKKASGAFDAPRYFWMRKQGDPPKAEELLMFPPWEAEDASLKLKEFVTKKLNEVKEQKISDLNDSIRDFKNTIRGIGE